MREDCENHIQSCFAWSASVSSPSFVIHCVAAEICHFWVVPFHSSTLTSKIEGTNVVLQRTSLLVFSVTACYYKLNRFLKKRSHCSVRERLLLASHPTPFIIVQRLYMDGAFMSRGSSNILCSQFEPPVFSSHRLWLAGLWNLYGYWKFLDFYLLLSLFPAPFWWLFLHSHLPFLLGEYMVREFWFHWQFWACPEGKRKFFAIRLKVSKIR